MEGFKHSVSFNDFKVDLTNNKITLDEDHRFLDGEEVIYTAGGTPIGVGATNIGFTTSLLSNGGTYFISHFTGNTKAFKIHISEENALVGINTIDFLAFGNNTHTFTAKKDRRRVAKIAVVNSGHGYQNNKVVVSSTKYPPEKQEDIFKTFQEVKSKWNEIDFVVHAIAFSDRAELSGQYIDTSRENFAKSMLVSCFSFTEIAKEASKIMKSGSSTVSYTHLTLPTKRIV